MRGRCQDLSAREFGSLSFRESVRGRDMEQWYLFSGGGSKFSLGLGECISVPLIIRTPCIERPHGFESAVSYFVYSS